MKKIIFSAITLCGLLVAAFTASAQTGTDSVKTATIKVLNLHCNNDMPTIKKQLLNQEGIDEVAFTAIESESSVFTVIYHSSATSRELIEKAIEATPGCDDQKETPYRVRKESTRKKKRS